MHNYLSINYILLTYNNSVFFPNYLKPFLSYYFALKVRLFFSDLSKNVFYICIFLSTTYTLSTYYSDDDKQICSF